MVYSFNVGKFSTIKITIFTLEGPVVLIITKQTKTKKDEAEEIKKVQKVTKF